MEEAKYQLVVKAAGWTSGSGYNYETVIDRIDITEEEYKRIKKTAVFDFVPIMFGDNDAGIRARDRIVNGEDYEKVISDMESEWKSFCGKNMWD